MVASRSAYTSRSRSLQPHQVCVNYIYMFSLYVYASFLLLFILYGGENNVPCGYRIRHKNVSLILNHDNFSDIEIAQPANLTVLELNYTVNYANTNQVSVHTSFIIYLIVFVSHVCVCIKKKKLFLR